MLGCHIVMEKGTCMDASLSNTVMVYSVVVVVFVVVMMKIVYRQV